MKFKFHRLTFLASVLLTTIMLLVALVFDLTKDRLQETGVAMYTSLFLSFMMMMAANYLVLELLFNFYGKRQIKRISTILPDEIINQEEEMNLRTLGEKVSEYSQKNADEIDTMKSMENYRKEYMGNISHELKTPLFSIQGYLETLMDGGVENINIRDKYLERINTLTERLLAIVVDLDMINKFETGEIELNISSFDLISMIQEIFDLLDWEASKTQAKFNLIAPQQVMVKADKQKIFQVLINLISNAVYYSNRENATITAIVELQGTKVNIGIEDNGMGIKPELLSRIFERFYRVESSRSRREGGSGLGLAIVKHILDAHHENISVKSIYLEGTVFTFSLPRSLDSKIPNSYP
ncbi:MULTISPECIES: sensor histidine kinase [Amniculibacterium]|uniref:sensor histidine kinase n=1 Tax=Amniculibacterium TaxID=2715289 RepID=UPI000F59BC46|nr:MULTISPECIES: ATP-binding protein [Amniculibacterium]